MSTVSLPDGGAHVASAAISSVRPCGIGQGSFFPCSPRGPCAALAAYFHCMGLWNRAGEFFPCSLRGPCAALAAYFHCMGLWNRAGEFFPCSLRGPCAALAAYFLCTGLRIKKRPTFSVSRLIIYILQKTKPSCSQPEPNALLFWKQCFYDKHPCWPPCRLQT